MPDILPSQKYYTLQQLLDFCKSKNVLFDYDSFNQYVIDGLLHPVIYIDSKTAHACTTNKDGTTVVFAFCRVSGYYDFAEDIIPAIDNLKKNKLLKIQE